MSVQIPIGDIKDPAALQAILAIEEQFRILNGELGTEDQWLITRKDLKGIGVVRSDKKDRLSNPLSPSAQALTDQQVVTATSDRVSQIATIDATAGIATGTHSTGITIPDNSQVIRAWYNVRTTFTSGTDAGTIAIGVNTDDAAGIVTAIAISDASNPWDAGLHATTPDGSQSNYTTKSTAARLIEYVVAVEALTAGILDLYVEYITTN